MRLRVPPSSNWPPWDMPRPQLLVRGTIVLLYFNRRLVLSGERASVCMCVCMYRWQVHVSNVCVHIYMCECIVVACFVFMFVCVYLCCVCVSSSKVVQ